MRRSARIWSPWICAPWIWAPWVGALALITVSVIWGIRLQDAEPRINLGAAPLIGRDPLDGWRWRLGWGLLGAAMIGAVVIVGVARQWWWRCRLRWLLPLTGTAAGAFATSLALTDGRDGLLHGAVHRTEYLANLATTPPAGEFLRSFVADIDRYSVHVRGHPPGFVLVLKMLDAIGLRGPWPVVALSIGGTVVVPVAALVAVWAVAGSDWVRRCAPLLVVAPYAVWMVTSADAVYTAVGSCGVAACTLGLRATQRAAVAWGALGGLLLGGLLMLTYGGAMFVLVPLVACLVALRRHDSGARAAAAVMVAAIVAGGAVVAFFWAYGFWWFAGAVETQRQYWAGTARLRPFAYFMLANLAASLIAVGPATFGGMIKMCELRRALNRVAVLVVGGAVALMAAHVSQYSRAEVERIWLLFFPWLALSGGMLVSRTNRPLAMMAVGAQVTGAVVLQAALVSKW